MKLEPDRYAIWGMAGKKSFFDSITPTAFRKLRFQFMGAPYQFKNNGCEVIEHAGWHFGYLGDKEWLIDKIKSFGHQEVNTPELLAQVDPDASIAKRTCWIQAGEGKEIYEIVALDEYFPRTVLENTEKYHNFILDNPVGKALDYLPPYPYNH